MSTGVAGETLYDDALIQQPKKERAVQDTTMVYSEGEEIYNKMLYIKTPRWRFSDGEKTLRCRNKPVAICIHKGETSFFAENEKLNIAEIGSTIDEAIDNFSETLIFFYEHYKDMPDSKVTSWAKKIKDLYNENFYEIQE